MEFSIEILKTFFAGFLLGGIFVMLKLPIPAPPTVAGIMGIVGVFAGYVVARHFL